MILTLLTFNAGLFYINFLGIPILPTGFVQQRSEQIPEKIISTEADVVAIQEVYLEKHKKFIVKKLQEKYPYYACEPRKQFRFLGSGLMIFSKYEISNVKFVPLKRRTIIGFFQNKGILTATIKLEKDNYLRVITFHTTARDLFKGYYDEHMAKIRGEEAGDILEEAGSKNDIPVILLGDLNEDDSGSAYKKITDGNFVDLFKLDEETKGNDPVQFTWDSENMFNEEGVYKEIPSLRVDHAFLKKDGYEQKFKLIDARIIFEDETIQLKNKKIPLSDHNGLYIKLEINQE